MRAGPKTKRPPAPYEGAAVLRLVLDQTIAALNSSELVQTATIIGRTRLAIMRMVFSSLHLAGHRSGQLPGAHMGDSSVTRN